MPDSPQEEEEEEEIEVEVEVEPVSDPDGAGVDEDDQGLTEVKYRLREAMPEVYWPMCRLGVDDNVFVDSQLAQPPNKQI